MRAGGRSGENGQVGGRRDRISEPSGREFLAAELLLVQLGLLSDFLLQHLSTELTREEVRDFLSS